MQNCCQMMGGQTPCFSSMILGAQTQSKQMDSVYSMLKFLTIRCQPYYLLREFTTEFAAAKNTLQKLHELIGSQVTKQLDGIYMASFSMAEKLSQHQSGKTPVPWMATWGSTSDLILRCTQLHNRKNHVYNLVKTMFWGFFYSYLPLLGNLYDTCTVC